MPPSFAKSMTDLAVKNAKPREKAYRLAIGEGLYIEVSPAGGKYWRMKYRVAGREKRLAIGVYPVISLAQAREVARTARALLRDGKDPSAEKQALKARTWIAGTHTFELVAREWLEVKGHEWTSTQLNKERDRLENHAFPWIGKLPIGEIGVVEIRPLLTRIVARGHLEQSHRLRHELSRIFRFAIATERATRDPAADLRDTLPARQKENFAAITDPAKVGELLRAIDGFGGTFPTACALKLAPLLFVRPGEIRAAEWSEFDLDHKDGAQWSIPPARRKLRKAQKENAKTPPHIVPLATQALEVLRELRPLTGHGRFLFPGARSAGRPMSDNTINAALRRLGFDKETMVGHGFRHMASTLLNELGWNEKAIERQLSHKEPGVKGVYDKAQHMPERRIMMQAWADYLDKLRSDLNASVKNSQNVEAS